MSIEDNGKEDASGEKDQSKQDGKDSTNDAKAQIGMPASVDHTSFMKQVAGMMAQKLSEILLNERVAQKDAIANTAEAQLNKRLHAIMDLTTSVMRSTVQTGQVADLYTCQGEKENPGADKKLSGPDVV